MSLARREESPPELSSDDYHRFTDFFYRRTGIQFGDNKRYFVDKRVQERMRKAGCSTFRDYLERVKRDDAEYQQLVNAMTVNETYFYREAYQLECLVNSILPAVVTSLGAARTIRIWSMPCSTGEEPYSIALYLLEHWPRVDEFEIEIVASDIDTEALARAKAGQYNQRSLQYVPADTIAKYTSEAADGERRMVQALRDSIRFTNANLLDVVNDRNYRGFHVVFCRNLLIYFDDVSRREAGEALYSVLAPGGFICLGHSESMSRISSLFELNKFPQAIVYRKPL